MSMISNSSRSSLLTWTDASFSFSLCHLRPACLMWKQKNLFFLYPLLFLYLLVTLQLPSSHFPFSFLFPSSLPPLSCLASPTPCPQGCVWEWFLFSFSVPPSFPSACSFFYSSLVHVPPFTHFSLVTFEILSSLSSRCSCSEHCAGGIMPCFQSWSARWNLLCGSLRFKETRELYFFYFLLLFFPFSHSHITTVIICHM